ncbi:MAG: hypothetical protein IT365_16985 [Candidatus Hydrogenedentes bacterium]|nr:hypothetical protein [Candidatus Hydrogenedentota bacterium]
MVRLLTLAVVAALGVTAAMDASNDQSPPVADTPKAEAAPELVARLMASPRPDELRKYLAHPNVNPKDLARFPMPVVRPDPSVDYKMIVVTPDPSAHYNMPIILPGEPVAGPDAEPNPSLQDFGWFIGQTPGQAPRIYRILPDGTVEGLDQE